MRHVTGPKNGSERGPGDPGSGERDGEQRASAKCQRVHVCACACACVRDRAVFACARAHACARARARTCARTLCPFLRSWDADPTRIAASPTHVSARGSAVPPCSAAPPGDAAKLIADFGPTLATLASSNCFDPGADRVARSGAGAGRLANDRTG